LKLFVALFVHQFATIAAERSFVPTFLWSGSSTFKQSSFQLLDEVSADDISGVVNKFVGEDKQVEDSLLGHMNDASSPEVVAVFVYDQLRTEQVSELSGATDLDSNGGAFSNLKAALDSSRSSLSVPYTRGSEGSFVNKLRPAVQGATLVSGFEHFSEGEIVSINDLLSRFNELASNGVPDLLVVNLGTLSPAQDELLGKVCKSLNEMTQGNFVAVVTADSTSIMEDHIQRSFETTQHAQREQIAHRRRLQAKKEAPKDPGACGGDGTCDYDIPITTNILVGLIVGAVLLIIFLVGFNCLFALQTPRKFDAAA
jgi:hypothetical protein